MTDPRVILLGVTGSTAYGMATPASDIDRQGVFQLDTWEILGRFNKGEQSADTIQRHEPDVAMHELGKYVRLASECNPTASEVLWLETYDVLTPAGQMLVDHRHLFLSQNVKARYSGYAKSQVKRLVERGRFDPGLRPAKHGRHVARLLIQAEQILTQGTLTVKLSPEDAEWCFEMGRLAETDPVEFDDAITPAINAVQGIPSDLPQRPDIAAIRDLLVTIRLMDL